MVLLRPGNPALWALAACARRRVWAHRTGVEHLNAWPWHAALLDGQTCVYRSAIPSSPTSCRRRARTSAQGTRAPLDAVKGLLMRVRPIDRFRQLPPEHLRESPSDRTLGVFTLLIDIRAVIEIKVEFVLIQPRLRAVGVLRSWFPTTVPPSLFGGIDPHEKEATEVFLVLFKCCHLGSSENR